jgi:SAM-dependent methyltransferase
VGRSLGVLGASHGQTGYIEKVPSQVVFALAGLGANVTSIDVSEPQMETARSRAAALGLQVDFVRADVVDLLVLLDAAFDVIYTEGHVGVWVSDLRRYYSEAARILKLDGLIVSEYHPFRRVWSDSASSLEIGFNYFNRGPHRFEAAPEVLYAAPGELEQFEFHWTVADYITAILASGCQLVHAEEFGDACETWKVRRWPVYPSLSCWLVAAADRQTRQHSTSRSLCPHRGSVGSPPV